MTDDDVTVSGTSDGRPKSLRFHFVKSQFFRAIHVDGAFGGLTPRGYIHAAIYNERRAIPQITEAIIETNATISKEVTIETKADIVREIEADLIFDVPAAEEFAKWLLIRVEEMKAAVQIALVTESKK